MNFRLLTLPLSFAVCLSALGQQENLSKPAMTTSMACLPLSPVEVIAALSGPGEIISGTSRNDNQKAIICLEKRVASDKVTDKSAFQFSAPGPELMLATYETGTSPPALGASGTNLQSLSDHASIYTGPFNGRAAHVIAVAGQEPSFVLVYAPILADQRSRDTAVQLAREVLDSYSGAGFKSHPIAEALLAQDRAALVQKPDDADLWNQIAILSLGLRQYSDAADGFERITDLTPNDPVGYFGLAESVYHASFAGKIDLLKLGITLQESLASNSKYGDVCDSFKNRFRKLIDRGYEGAKRALKLRPNEANYAAMAALLSRERQDTDCGDAAAALAHGKEVSYFTELNSKNVTAPERTSYREGVNLGPSGWVYLVPFSADNGSPKEETARGNLVLSLSNPAPPPPPPPPPAGRSPTSPGIAAKEVDLGLQVGLLLKKVDPVYPEKAIAAGIQGTVVLAAIIAGDGSIRELKPVSGPPELTDAAIDAVKQWKYKPYILNGEPVQVSTQIQVNFASSFKIDSVLTDSVVLSNETNARTPVSAKIMEGLLTNQAPPTYPQLARQARIQGTVLLKALIAKDGSIKSVELVSGHPMLVTAAIEAVKQWKFKPYLMNQKAAEVETRIQITFTGTFPR